MLANRLHEGSSQVAAAVGADGWFLREHTQLTGAAQRLDLVQEVLHGVCQRHTQRDVDLGAILQPTVGRVTGLNAVTLAFTGVLAASLFQSAAAGMISIVEDRENDFSRELFKEGVLGTGIAFPTVPEGKARIRTIMTATHTKEELERTLEVLGRVGKRMGILR